MLLNRFLQVTLAVIGIGVIAAGLTLIFIHEQDELGFQVLLLWKSASADDYHWRSIGNSYAGIAAVAIGSLMMAVAAVIAGVSARQPNHWRFVANSPVRPMLQIPNARVGDNVRDGAGNRPNARGRKAKKKSGAHTDTAGASSERLASARRVSSEKSA
jgi:hypothetical protein